ncbi:hypothetical protein BC628DRAFT_1315177 [Trametes gibbosa]|nr:hypothetical protein BC628DRAFT_1315177 [Trametes gibbosa]
MDHAPVAFQDGVDAEQMRMSSFKLGKPSSPLDTTMSSKPARHSRSHSRNSSVSTSMSFPLPPPSHASLTPVSDSPPPSPTRNSLGGAKRNSHHRRRSSVSTRRESADMMGVSLPSLPQSSSEDNINLGDKDSVRRRALWALEGKPAVGNFSVEIPELDMPEVPKRSFDFPSKPSFPPGVGAGFGGGLNTLMGNKRDSKFIVSSPSSELLGTLIEEEEEEEDEGAQEIVSSPVQESPMASQAAVIVTSPSPAPARHRPASLNLRPLSLALNNSVRASNGELPSPSRTPGPRAGLKSLTLPSSQSLSGLSSNTASSKRQSLIMSSPDPTSNSFGRRPSLNLSMDNTVTAIQASRRSSISYVSSNDVQAVSMFGLPTPEMTPTSSTIDRRRSTSTSSTSSFDMDHLRGRPLSTSEQHFLFQAHQTLVQRITDLERALKRPAPRSRPVSCASDVSSASAISEPSDEMLQLIADLKSERDELKRDVDGWRTRVADMEHQIDVHAKRLDVERRDAWVARQRLGLLEVEKFTLEKTLSEKTMLAEETQTKLDAAQHDLKTSQDDIIRLTAEVERMRGVDEECARIRAELLQERTKREEVERELEHAGLLDTPRPFGAVVQNIPSVVSRTMMYAKSRGLGFRSIDSESSFTDVDEDENRGPELKVVEEVEEDDDCESMYDDDVNELARYEEEDENDEYAFPTSSSYGSVADYSRSSTPRLSGDSIDSAPALVISRSPSASPSPLPSPAEPTHARHATLIKAWSFPTPGSGMAVVPRQPEEMDRFFACLEDVDNSPPLDSKLRSVESGKSLFSQALADFEDDLPPFVIPSDVGEIVLSPELDSPQHVLDVVVEEEEEEEQEEEEQEGEDDKSDSNGIVVDDEFIGEEDEGGIKFTFGPPPFEYCTDADTSTPDLTMASTPESTTKTDNFFGPLDDDEVDSSFTSHQLKTRRTSPLPSAIPRLKSPSPSPSKLPVAVPSTSTPVKASSPLPWPPLGSSPIGFSTPPPKRTPTIPTFIPQPRLSVPRTPSPPSVSKVASSIPQPKRVPAAPRSSAIPVMSPPTSSRHPLKAPFVASMCV